MNTFKFQPRYLWQLTKLKKVNLVFVTCDPRCLTYIQKAKGVCLFCDENITPKKFNFGICYQCEAWVFYSDDKYQKSSIQLGRAIQLAGASKVQIIPFPITEGGV